MPRFVDPFLQGDVSGPLEFRSESKSRLRRVQAIASSLPPLAGRPIRILGGARLNHRADLHAGSFLRERRIAFNCAADEFPRVLVHEIFHFVWLRLGNPVRRSYEGLLRAEGDARGELGWSAEWRKAKLSASHIQARSRKWREYCCESFCDTAAWLYSGVKSHDEFTLPVKFRARRRRWFRETIENRVLSV